MIERSEAETKAKDTGRVRDEQVARARTKPEHRMVTRANGQLRYLPTEISARCADSLLC